MWDGGNPGAELDDVCTISIISTRGLGGSAQSLRIVCNRDEHRERSPALPPRWHVTPSGVRALWPIDTHAGGTWIAAGAHGLALLVLNLNPEPPVNLLGVPGLVSRGLLIPELIGLRDAAEVVERVRGMDLRRFGAFRLAAVEGGAPQRPLAELRWDRTRLDVAWRRPGPMCLVSSGLGDARVAGRLELFEEMVVRPGAAAERQDEFHRHFWPERREVSVLMSRAEARTVSITTLQIGDRVRMRYEPVPEEAGAGLGAAHLRARSRGPEVRAAAARSV